MLYLLATPIGNLEDISLRALRILKEADFILAEDTRKTGLLLKHFNIDKLTISFHDHNEAQKTPQIVKMLQEGKHIALVSSAGIPVISDPGYKLVRECRHLNLAVTAAGINCSIINALALSSLPHDKFVFIGYLPRKAGQLKKLFEQIKSWEAAIVFFESPFRIIKSLGGIKGILGNKKITIAREMTKKFEEIAEMTIGEALKNFKDKQPKGEFTVVLDNRPDE